MAQELTLSRVKTEPTSTVSPQGKRGSKVDSLGCRMCTSASTFKTYSKQGKQRAMLTNVLANLFRMAAI